MKTASLFRNGRNQAVRIPKELEFENVNKVEIKREGRSVILTPIKRSWHSLVELPKVDEDFLDERPDLIPEGRF